MAGDISNAGDTSEAGVASGTIITAPTGRGSTGGGGGDVVHSRHSRSAGSSPVTNQALLALDSNVYDNITDEQASNLKLIQLEFARDVSSRAAAAYDEIIKELRSPGVAPAKG